MPVFSGAIPQLMSHTTTPREYWWILGVKFYRATEWKEYSVPYYDDPPETQVATTPAGYTYSHCENRRRTLLPNKGDHVDFFKKEGDWTPV